MKVDKAIIKYCNKISQNRLAADLRERNEFEEREELRAKRKWEQNRKINPNPFEDSDDSSPEDTTQKRLKKMIELKKMTREERITEVVKLALTQTEVEYLVGTLRKNKAQRSIDDLSKIWRIM